VGAGANAFLTNNLMASPPKQAAQTRIGCGFLVVAALLTCVLLGINGLIVMNLVNAVLPTLPPEWRHNSRIAQAAVFVGPLVLLVIEWWVCDVTIDWLKPAPQDTSRADSGARDVTLARSGSEGNRRRGA
jgi:hypothetical protein